MNTAGERIKITIFGESHGKGIGITLDGLPAGIEISHELIRTDLGRRQAVNTPYSTGRLEKDEYTVLSGEHNGRTNGYPLTIWIENENADGSDAELYSSVPRPGHADYPAIVKFGKYVDIRGGGEFSGRMTAALVAAGSVAKGILRQKGIGIYAYTAQIGSVKIPDNMSAETIISASSANSYTVPDEKSFRAMLKAVEDAKNGGDSIGGVIECITTSLPAGLGDPFFGSVESRISAMAFSIPGVKGIYFGDGLNAPYMAGSEFNDPLALKDGSVAVVSNHSGGVNGGITNGQRLKFGLFIRPPSSIKKEQKSVDLSTLTEKMIALKGRYDPCIVPRAVVAVENASAIVLLDLLMGVYRWE